MKNLYLVSLIFGALLLIGCGTTEILPPEDARTIEPLPDYMRYLQIGTTYQDNPNLGDKIDFPIIIHTVDKDLVGTPGQIKLGNSQGVIVPETTFDFILGEQDVELTVPIVIEKPTDGIGIGEFVKFDAEGKIMQPDIMRPNSKEINFGRRFTLTPVEALPPPSTGQLIEVGQPESE